MRPSIALAAALLLAAHALPAQAQQGAPAARLRETLRQLDADGDGTLLRAEVPEAGRAAFDRLLKRGDENKDGKLQADELKALARKVRALADARPPAERLKAMDKDGDGKVARSEFTGPAMGFNRLDADKDGFISAEEVAEAPASPASYKAKAKRPGTAKAKGKAGAALQRLKAMDKDGDGKISREEFPREKLFDRLDADDDGFLTPAELAEARKPK